MKLPFTNIRFEVTRQEKIGVTAAALSVWPLFSLAFGSAPLTIITAIGTPAATTLLTGTVMGIGYGVKKVAEKITDKLEDYAATEGNENSLIAKYLAPAYQAELDADEELDSDLEDDSDLDLDENLAQTEFDSYAPRTLTHWQERTVRYNVPAITREELDEIPVNTTRSGMCFGSN
ncbi:hypothetical protein [Candidatus Berkiella aquae]|uniref:Uncharacterized protein n=1 Tax=Candidatus Berkiella aquae TaxID=295108 RepID=A0A0Q9YNJ0_9GAMM|nr:hypothetical protein [Candidatus Berkiella aquae]MCS5712425.1 hypothetical protein [Candidatus Berkiella aquae]